METRKRGRRQQSAATASAPVKRRRGTPPAQEDAESHGTEVVSAEGPARSQESTGGIKPHKLGSRRGAPRPPESDNLELATPRRAVNEDAEEDDEQVVHDRGAPRRSQEDADDELSEARRTVMGLSLSELSRATDKLAELLRKPQRGSALYHHMLKLRRNAFLAMRETYEEPQGFPFIDAAQFGDFGQYTEEGAATLGCANLASALDIIEALQSGNDDSVLGRLTELDDFFDRLFAPFGSDAQNLELSLDVRTLRLIETLVGQKSKAEFNRAVATVFCEPFEARGKIDYPRLLINGSRRPLGHRDDDKVDDSCSDRIRDIINTAGKDKRASAASQLNQLRRAYPQERILEDLRSWVLSVYDSRNPAQRAERQNSPAHWQQPDDEFVDAEEQIARDGTESEPESQPIVRAQDQQIGSLFKGAESLRALDKAARQDAAVPPLTQQQARAPADYHHHGNDLLLGARPHGVAAPQSRRAVPSSANRDEDDEDDGFEQDQRQINKGKAAAISHTLQTTRTAPRSSPSSSMPPPPRVPSHVRSTNPPSSPLDALREEKRLLVQQHRASTVSSTPSSFRQRHPWSDHDANLLITLIRERHAAWSLIESSDNAKFERPRHQQAYRDKARNMKVDYLMTDAVLPPCFDLVALGKKEVDRLISFGKNPWRKENDVDEDGNAVNTEYETPLGGT